MMHAPRTRVQRHPVHGVLLLDKPLGLSSNDALQKVKWLLRAEKAGHTGTLDPLATGVLPLCFGAATKFSQMQLDAAKTYAATVRLGTKTATGDAEGEVLQERPVDSAEVERLLPEVLQRFTGPILQVPPMHSALKRDGKPLYEYARQGIEIERAPRAVEIHALEAALAVDAQGLLAIELVVTCSKGTYIRTLGEEIGEALGCGGHLTMLRRTATGHYSLGQAVTLQALEAMEAAARQACLLPVDSLLPDHTRVTLAGDDVVRFLSGVRRRGRWADSAHIVVFGAEARGLLGTAHASAGELIPGRLLSPIEIQQIQESTPHAANTAQGIEEANV